MSASTRGTCRSSLAPASPPAESIRNLSILVLAITGFIFLVVEGVLLLCDLSASAGARPRTTTSEPPQVYGSKPIEIAWTAAPALIVFILVLVTTRTLWEVNADPARSRRPGDQALFVTVDRPPVVVGISLRSLRRQATRLHHGQRAAHPGERRTASPGPSI